MMDHETFVLDGISIMVVGGTKDAIELVNGKYDSIWRSGRDKGRFGDVAFVDVGVGNEVRLSEHIIIGVTVHGLDGRGVGLLIHDFMMQLQCIIGLKLSSFFPKHQRRMNSNYDGMEAVAIQEWNDNNSLLFVVVAAKNHREGEEEPRFAVPMSLVFLAVGMEFFVFALSPHTCYALLNAGREDARRH